MINTPWLQRFSCKAVLILSLLMTAVGAKAEDYVLAYVNGGTTYYLARNGTSGVERVTDFDPTTCVWSCASNTAGTTAGTLNNSNTYGYLYQTVGGTRYFLNASANALGLGTNAGADNYYRWRTNGTYVYNRYNNNTSYYINLANGVVRNTTANTASNARPYAVTTSTVAGSLTGVTISGDETLTATGTYSYSASGTYTNSTTNYIFNGTNHYSPAQTTSTETTSGTWTVSGTGASYVSVNASTGAITVNSLPTDADKTITLQCAPEVDGTTASAVTKTITLKADTRPVGNPTGITATAMNLNQGGNADGNNYTLTAASGYRPFDWVTAESSDPAIASVTNTNGTFTITAEAEGTATITITAYNQDKTTVAATTTFTVTVTNIESGVSGGTVTLYDYEDHRWSYYSDPDCPIRSLNPADVKITYFGNGTGTVQSNTNSDTPSTWGADATTVKVGIDADASTFVYHKTLERADGSTAASVDAATGRCAYTTIPNPFSVRPTYDSDNTSKYRGFYAWRVKTLNGGTIHSAATGGTSYAVGSIINAETEIYFAPSASTGMEVEFEALWARAYVSTSGAGNHNLGVERNFYVITASANSDITAGSYPCTYTSIYPNGTTNGTTVATSVTVYKRSSFTAAADSKIEYIRLNNNNNNVITAAGYNLTIGRGVTAYNGTYCAATVRGMAAGSTAALDYTIRVESGSFENFYLVSSATQTYQSTVSTKAVFGCDYDRASNTNNLLSLAPSGSSNHKTGNNAGSGEIYGGSQMRCSSAFNKDNLTFDWLIKSGTFHEGQLGSASGGDESIYLGSSQSGSYMLQYIGKRRIIVEGGDLAGIAGGMNSATSNGGSDYNNTTHVTQSTDDYVVIRIKGGTMRSSVYGAAAFAGASGGRKFIFTGGTIAGWVAGGANGTQTDGGTLYGPTNLYIGGNTRIDSNGSTSVINRAVGGNVFGAGCGYGASSNSGQILSYGTTVIVADDAYIERGVYGGGSYGYTTNTASLYILGGTVDGKPGGVNGTSYQATITGGVYGGACQNQGGTVNITMTGGQVNGGVYGGSNATGTISGSVTMNINGGQVGTTSQAANIHGGGYGSATRVSQNVDLTLGTSGQTTGGVTVYGDVYGGSALGYVNGTAATNTYHTYVTLNKGTINGSLYGGGLGDASTAANVYGPVAVKVYGGSVKKTSADGSGGVYGANNVNGAPQRSVTVDIYGTDPAPSTDAYALYAVYGGGNQADYTYGNGYPKVTVHNCDNSIEYVYGGGNAAAVASTDVKIYGGNTIGTVFGGGNGTVTAANVTGNTSVNIYGGTIGSVFGGSNSQGTIGGTITVNVAKQGGDSDPDGSATACAMHIDEVYGGGNMAASQAGSITIGCTGDQGEGIGDVYGGANQANITGNIALNITGGSIQRVFGGNNTSGNISGTIQVDVNWATTNPCGYNYLGNVFGGGNLATYTGSPAVNILNGTVSGNVYGGGAGNLVDGADRGVAGKVTGNPTVTIGDNVSGHTAIVSGDVYGGGDAADVAGTPVIVVNDCNTEIGYLYGGGNAADVNGTNITVNGGTIHHDAFGGGHGDKNASNPSKYADVKGNVVFNVYGGTFDRVFAGSNSKGDITGTSALTINKTGTCDMKIREVYGGGNEAAGNAGSVTIGCTGAIVTGDAGHAAHPDNIGTTLEGIGTVYGGANAADIGKDGSPSNITLNINSGMVNNVFGGNNTSGTIYGTIAVNINKNAATCGWYVGNVFGGGNLAAYSGSPTVTVTNGEVSHNVYGGGNEAGVGGSEVNINGGSVIDGVYGGCNTSGNVSGDIVVNINGGTLGTSGAPLTSGIFGGGFGEATTTGGNVTVNVGDANATSAAATSTIYGDIYGGSALGTVNDAVADVTTVNINNGTIHGNIYGGGLGAATLNSNGYIDTTQPKTEAIVNGTVHVNIGTSTQASNFVTIDGQVFGCNNLAGTPKGPVYVDVYHTAHTTANATPTPPATAADVASLPSTAFAIAAVYGGGNLAHYTTTESGASTHVHIHNCDNTIEYVYGGGNAASSPATDVVIDGGRFNYIFGGGNGAGTGNPGADIEGDAKATINGGVIYRAFGGSNTKGNIGGTSSVELPDATICDPRLVHELFGGGNEAPGGNVDMVIPCGTTGTGIVYAGANKADMGTKEDFEAGRPVLIKLTVEGGDFTQVFGGNNESGTIWGNVELHLLRRQQPRRRNQGYHQGLCRRRRLVSACADQCLWRRLQRSLHAR